MNPVMALAGFGVGIVVGLTGMGGGALMTPVLVLFFGVPPLAAVSSDLVASAVMKPFGGWVHAVRGTVHWRLVGWLCAGSVPAAFTGALLMRLVGSGGRVQHVVQLALAVALLLAALGLLLKAYNARRRTDTSLVRGDAMPPVRIGLTVALGAIGGLIVGLTSVGSGSLIIVVLLALYPTLRANDLVGTDLVQAVPLVAAAALGHALFGDLHMDIAATVVVGSVPGVLLGARISSRAPGSIVRTALVVVLVASSLKLFGVGNAVVAVTITTMALAAVALAIVQRTRRRASRQASPQASAATTGASIN